MLRQIFGLIFGFVIFVFLAIAMIPIKILNIFLLERPTYPEAFEPYFDKLNFYDGRQVWGASCAGVPRKAVLLYGLHWAHLEIANGGFWQFFFNSSGVLAPEARDGFRAIGMADVADVIQRAMDRLGQPYPFDRERRQEIVGAPDKRMDFGSEDDAFHALAGNPKLIGGAPRYFPQANAYAQAD